MVESAASVRPPELLIAAVVYADSKPPFRVICLKVPEVVVSSVPLLTVTMPLPPKPLLFVTDKVPAFTLTAPE